MTIAISAETSDRLRAWKRKAAARFATLDRQLEEPSLRDEVLGFVRRGSLKGRARDFENLRRRLADSAVLEGVRLDGPDPLAVWVVLKPREAIAKAVMASGGEENLPEPRDAQDCVVVEYLVVGALPEVIGYAAGLWTLEITDYALGRLLQRSPGADLDGVLLDAHHAALRARLDDVTGTPANPKRLILLPAGTGVFRCEIRMGPDVSADRTLSLYLFAHTWLHNDQLHTDQTPLLVDGTLGERLGEGFLLPVPLRRLIKTGPGQVQVATWAPGMPETLARPMGRA
jgi:hypothetical protein